VVDTLRSDHLSAYGYDGIRTPRIDALAASGVRFEQAVTHVPITLPSFSSLMTSTLPPTNGVHYNEGFRLDESAVTLAEILRDAGYQTGAVVSAVVLDSISGLAQGFERYDDDLEMPYKGYQAYARTVEEQLSHTQIRAETVTDKALSVADSFEQGRPFFLFVHYFDPHAPYDPPPPYNLVDPLVEIGSTEHARQLYDGEIAYADAQIGRLLDGLRALGRLDSTLIVLTADHGEALDEHGERTHAYFTYESTLRVPLIYALPGRLPAGLVLPGPARHIDLVPTILDILGAGGGATAAMQGVSLHPFTEERVGGPAYIECATSFVVFRWSGLRGLRSRAWKYVDAPVPELYDLLDDPGETRNLAGERPAVADSLRGELERYVGGLDLFHGAEPGQEMSLLAREAVDAEMQEKLRALGYIGGGEEVDAGYEAMFDPSLPDPKDTRDDFARVLSALLDLRMGIALMAADSLESAVTHLERAVREDSTLFDPHYFLGLARGRLGEEEAARVELERALEIDPDHADARLSLARLCLARGDTSAALVEIEAALSIPEPTTETLIRAARLWGRLGMQGRVAEAMERALEVDPDFIPARLYIGELLLQREEYGRALSVLEPLDGREMGDSLTARALYSLGRCYYHEGDLARSEACFRGVIEADSGSAGAFNYLGLILDGRGRFEEALAAYDRALRLGGEMPEVRINRAVTLYKVGRYQEALEDVRAYLPDAAGEEEADRVRSFIALLEGLLQDGENSE
jgi:arylsulfatase A-like enzyme/Flp pilus assembly protein TadD